MSLVLEVAFLYVEMEIERQKKIKKIKYKKIEMGRE